MKVLLVGLLCLFCPGILALNNGEIAPAFQLTEHGSEALKHKLSEYQGKVVYLDFWAAWCGPCRVSVPDLVTLQAELGSDSFVVLAINLDTKTRDADRFLERFPVNYTVLSDPKGKVAQLYELPGMPTSFLIDREGNIAMIHVGYRTGDIDSIRNAIENLLND